MTNETPGGATGTMDPVEIEYLAFDTEGSPVSIRMNPGVMEGIAHDVAEGAGAEAGGLLLVENNHAAWMAGMVSMIESPELRSKMRSAARRIVRSRFVTSQRRRERTSLIAALPVADHRA